MYNHVFIAMLFDIPREVQEQILLTKTCSDMKLVSLYFNSLHCVRNMTVYNLNVIMTINMPLYATYMYMYVYIVIICAMCVCTCCCMHVHVQETGLLMGTCTYTFTCTLCTL